MCRHWKLRRHLSQQWHDRGPVELDRQEWNGFAWVTRVLCGTDRRHPVGFVSDNLLRYGTQSLRGRYCRLVP